MLFGDDDDFGTKMRVDRKTKEEIEDNNRTKTPPPITKTFFNTTAKSREEARVYKIE